jgi:hypothetical protein
MFLAGLVEIFNGESSFENVKTLAFIIAYHFELGILNFNTVLSSGKTSFSQNINNKFKWTHLMLKELLKNIFIFQFLHQISPKSN